MAGITRQVETPIVDVDLSDSYGVVVRQIRRTVEYSPAEALELAAALRACAHEAERARVEDGKPWTVPAAPPLSHGFDVAPICRECSEEKHGACNGTALLEVDDDVEEYPCGCREVAHQVIGGRG